MSNSIRWLGAHGPVRLASQVCVLALAMFSPAAGAGDVAPDRLDAAARQWVERTLAALSVEDLAGQVLMPGIHAGYTSTDSDAFESWRALVEGQHVGGVIVYGETEPAPGILLDAAYSTSLLGDPLSTAATLNRLQSLARVPLLTAGDFEYGVGMRIEGATVFPRAMAFGAAGDPALVEAAAAITAREMRALGLHMNFAPVADVNNNARNPVINTRSFGEDPQRVGSMVAAAVRGMTREGVIATLKHFPGHGDTGTDTHLGLATLPHERGRLETLELPPFRAGLAAGAPAVMTGHLLVPALDPDPDAPATLSRAIVTGVLRGSLGFGGLVVTDSMSMSALQDIPPGEAAVRAIEAGDDILLDPPDPAAARTGIVEAVASGRLSRSRLETSVRRLLEAKARLGLHRARTVPLDRVADVVGTRASLRIAREASARGLTLLDERGAVPLRVGASRQDRRSTVDGEQSVSYVGPGFSPARDGSHVLVLTLVDYSSNWRGRAPGSELVAGLRARWPELTAIELTDRSARDEIDLVRALAPRFDVVVAALFVRTASGSGRMDLAPPLVALLQDLARAAETRPLVVCVLGSPYAAAAAQQASAVLVTFDLGRLAERSAADALIGEAPIHGRLPVTLPGVAGLGAGVDRPPAVARSR